MKKIFDVLNVIKQKLFVKKDKIHSEKYYRRIDFLNKYSLLFHAIIAMAIVFIVEIISRRSFISACKFVDAHTLAFMYNSFLVFVSFSLVYLFSIYIVTIFLYEAGIYIRRARYICLYLTENL